MRTFTFLGHTFEIVSGPSVPNPGLRRQYRAAGLVGFVDPDNPIYYIDPKPAYTPDYPGIQVIKATATAGMKELISKLKEND